jgi:hypothetical protein
MAVWSALDLLSLIFLTIEMRGLIKGGFESGFAVVIGGQQSNKTG